MAFLTAFSVFLWSSRNFSRVKKCGRGILESRNNWGRVDSKYRVLKHSFESKYRVEEYSKYRGISIEEYGKSSQKTLPHRGIFI